MFQEKQKVGQYTLLKKLAKGGFGEVWLAEKQSPLVTKKVAVKLPHDSQVNIETIKQEATLWEQASGHPNVLPIIDADIYDGQVVIVSEYVEDGSLSDKIKKSGGKLPVEEAVRIAVGILNGLEYLHSKGIIHRDIKPANILMQGETPRLADFGISRAMQTENVSTAVVGTYNYMSPESFEGVRNARTDVWAVGVVLYQLLNGLPPYPQREPSEAMYAILMKDYDLLPDEIPTQLREIVYKSLEKDQLLNGNPPRRYQTAAEMRDDLNNFLTEFGKTFETKPTVSILREDAPTQIKIPVAAEYERERTGQTFFSRLSPFAALMIMVAALGIIWVTLYLFNRPSSVKTTQATEAAPPPVQTPITPVISEADAKNFSESIVYSKQGEEYFREKQYDSAIAAFTKSIELNPNDFGAYNNRGIAYHVKRDFDKAIADYTKAIDLNPAHFSGYNNRGAAYEDMKKYDLALADFQKATEVDPGNEKAKENLERVTKRAQ